jgi:hypothetical protein
VARLSSNLVPTNPVTPDELEWHRHRPLPGPVGLCYVAPDGQHPLTPYVVRERHIGEVMDSSLVVWRSTSLGRFGLSAGSDELAWKLSFLRTIEWSFCRPAKGAYQIALDIDWHLELSSDRSEIGLLDWLDPVLGSLNMMLPRLIKRPDTGYDV